MFTRVVEINAKSGKGSELANTIHEKVLPILKKQAGFVDETVLTSDTEPNRIVSSRPTSKSRPDAWLDMGKKLTLAHLADSL